MPDKYRCHYFNATALGEPLRYLLAYGKLDWEDVRYGMEQTLENGVIKNTFAPEWQQAKPLAPFGQLPFLEINGKPYAQSTAVCRYLGKKVGLYGASDLENMKIDIAIDLYHDLRIKIVGWFFDQNVASRAAKKDPLFQQMIPFYLDKLEEIVRENGGFIANGKLSWGDLFFAAPIPFLNNCVGMDLLKQYPILQRVVDRVHAVPQIAAYLAKRPKTAF